MSIRQAGIWLMTYGLRASLGGRRAVVAAIPSLLRAIALEAPGFAAAGACGATSTHRTASVLRRPDLRRSTRRRLWHVRQGHLVLRPGARLQRAAEVAPNLLPGGHVFRRDQGD